MDDNDNYESAKKINKSKGRPKAKRSSPTIVAWMFLQSNFLFLVYFVIVYREEVHKNHEYIQNVKMAMLKSLAPQSWVRMFSQTNF